METKSEVINYIQIRAGDRILYGNRNPSENFYLLSFIFTSEHKL